MRVSWELFREQHAARLRDGDRRRAEVFVEETPQLALADAEAQRDAVDVAAVERADGDQRECARHAARGRAPAREVGRALGPAAQAGRNPPPAPTRRSGNAMFSNFGVRAGQIGRQ
jgi:hypothetical protein